MTYTTVQGDTFDRIAKQIYGNERRMDALLLANPHHMGVVVFPAGVVLQIPGLDAEQTQSAAPPWRRQ